MLELKDPVKVKAGQAGAAKRWGGPETKVVRLDDLTAPQRRLVLALVDAARKEAGSDVQSPDPAGGGGTHDADSAA